MRNRRNAGREIYVALKIRRDRTDEIHAWKKLDLGDQRDDEFRFAPGDVHLRASRLRIEDQFVLYGLRDSQTRKHIVGMRRACASWIEADGFCIQQGLFQR